MKIALFEPNWDSFSSRLIAKTTKTPWSHAAVEIDGQWYDASETRGDFNKVDINKTMKGRLAHVWRIGNRKKVRKMIEENLGSEYDYKGIYKYFFKKGVDRRFYCFEAAMVLALAVKEPEYEPKLKNVTGKDIVNLLGVPNEIKTF